jgi:hypothetical protein
MVTVEGVKFGTSSPLTFSVPDASSYHGESTLWYDKDASGTLQLWFKGASFVFTRTGGADGTYTLEAGSTSNTLEIFDEAFSWESGSRFVLTAGADPFPPGLPPTNAYNYIPVLSDTGQGITFSEFSCVSGDSDVYFFNLTFSEKPESTYTFTVDLYYQRN